MWVACAAANNVVAYIGDMHLRKGVDNTTHYTQYIAVSACNTIEIMIMMNQKYISRNGEYENVIMEKLK